MKTLYRSGSWLAALPLIVLSLVGVARADLPPIAGPRRLGVSAETTAVVAKGWSGRKDLMGKTVYNDRGDKIGSITDVIVGPDKTASFAIVSTGGFVGLGQHDVAIPFSQLEMNGSKIDLPGATKDALKALPEFEYAK